MIFLSEHMMCGYESWMRCCLDGLMLLGGANPWIVMPFNSDLETPLYYAVGSGYTYRGPSLGHRQHR